MKVTIYEGTFTSLCKKVLDKEITFAFVISGSLHDEKDYFLQKLYEKNRNYQKLIFKKIKSYRQSVEVNLNSPLAELNTVSVNGIKKYKQISRIALPQNSDNFNEAGINDVLEKNEGAFYTASYELYNLLITFNNAVGITIGESKKEAVNDSIVRIPVRDGWTFHFGYVYLEEEKINDSEKEILNYIIDKLS